MASYGTVIEYFSNKNVTIEQVLTRYLNHFKINVTSKKGDFITKKHELIYDHFHNGYCFPKNLSGFDFISQLHNDNILETLDSCQIGPCKFTSDIINDDQINLIRNELLDEETLAIILYKTNINTLHAEAIGFDNERNEYFHKDPEKTRYEFGDILSTKEITEYIIFKAYSE